MVETREARPSLENIAAILENQFKMQQEFVEFKKKSVEEMDALRQENLRVKRKVKAEGVVDKGKEKEILNDPYMT